MVQSYKKKILVVDDNEINRGVLKNILDEEYEVIEAQNGQEALGVLKQCGEEISLILLDIIMPVMDGYEFLDVVKSMPAVSSVPIIVTTIKNGESDEIRCLISGASDFVSKPYNPEIVKHRVASIIRLRESSAMVNMLKYDQLTGLYSKEFFYQQVQWHLDRHPEKEFDIICSDIENFKMINERYGADKGDELLRYMANKCQRKLGEDDICARIGADIFVIMTEHRGINYNEDMEEHFRNGYADAPVPNLIVKFGIYENVDRKLTPSAMCDRAMLAMRRIKNKYGHFAAKYDDSLRLTLIREQQILDNMEQALKEKQFAVYYQPKHDIRTGAISGVEALVRWQHPEFGFMPPGEFIPIFERNGFITKLDYYVWEETCRMQRKWIDEGIPVVPVSVNISRVDFGIPDLTGQIEALVDKYDIDHELFHLEVTETAYTENPQQIIDVVNELRKKGFKIEMDDFGSGYSSLNMLSELPIDILKLDMQFVRRGISMQKNSILSFVISLSKWLNLDVIAEGVETSEQVENLRMMGCNYVQGFFYAKPMPADVFEEYLKAGMKKIVPEIKKNPLNENEKDELLYSMERKYTVLVAEDIEMNRELLKEMLSDRYQIVFVQNGKEAYEYLLEHSQEVSVVLLDLMMPVMSGFQLMDILHKNDELSDIPVIIISEEGTDSELRALKMGAEGFACKPYQREVLIHRIDRAIDRLRLKKMEVYLQKLKEENN